MRKLGASRPEKGGLLSPTVQQDVGPAHVARQGGGEEEACVSYVFRFAQSTHRNRSSDRCDAGFVSVVEMGLHGLDHPRGDRIDADEGSPLHRQAAGQRKQSCFGRTIRCGSGGGPDGAHAGYVDNRPALWLLLHDSVGLLAQVERGDQVETENRFRKPRGYRGGLRLWGAARIIDKNI